VRALAKRAFGLANSGKTDVLLQRMHQCLNDQQAVMRTNQEWFVMDTLRSHGIIPYKSVWKENATPFLLPVSEFTIDSAAVLASLTGQADAWERWQLDSNIIISSCFNYLDQLEHLIAREFEMYRAFLNDNITGQKGWLRNMYHALIQQLL
jgi:hypothetical protein